jgi:hypothetical protein
MSKEHMRSILMGLPYVDGVSFEKWGEGEGIVVVRLATCGESGPIEYIQDNWGRIMPACGRFKFVFVTEHWTMSNY